MAELIECNANIMLGKAAIKGTRMSVELIVEKIAAGESFEDILAAHSSLTPEMIRTAVHVTAQALKAEAVYPLAEKAA